MCACLLCWSYDLIEDREQIVTRSNPNLIVFFCIVWPWTRHFALIVSVQPAVKGPGDKLGTIWQAQFGRGLVALSPGGMRWSLLFELYPSSALLNPLTLHRLSYGCWESVGSWQWSGSHSSAHKCYVMKNGRSKYMYCTVLCVHLCAYRCMHEFHTLALLALCLVPVTVWSSAKPSNGVLLSWTAAGWRTFWPVSHRVKTESNFKLCIFLKEIQDLPKLAVTLLIGTTMASLLSRVWM